MTFTYTFALGWRWPMPVPKLTPTQIVAQVAEKHGLSIGDLRGRSRKPRIAWARQEAMSRLYKETAWSLPHIGQYLGGRDHTTVLFGIRSYEARVRGDEVSHWAAVRDSRRKEALDRRLAHAAEQRGERVAA